MLYPSIDFARPNLRATKAVMKKPTVAPKEFNPESSQMSSISQAETRVSSGERETKSKAPKNAVSIAP